MRVLLIALFLLTVPAAVRAEAPGWPGYQAIVWQSGSAARAVGLRALGFDAGALVADRDGSNAAGLGRAMAVLRQAGLRWYLENTATDFYSPYHRWQPGKSVTWLFDQTRQAHQADPDDPAVFIRTPSLSDPVWRERIRLRLGGMVRAQRADRPLFYNLADEAGLADLAAFWDFDLSAPSLAGFRAWLPTQYRDLGALNREWGSNFARWDAVVPMMTDAALGRSDDNFAAWADFKEWMDVAFAGAVRAGTAAVHAADPAALAGLEGAQPPGWGGYDYTRLAGAVDVMESTGGGNAIEIARAFNPALVVLTTSFGKGPAEARAIWRALLLGGRGLVVWDEDDTLAPGGVEGPRGRFLAPLLRELHGAAVARLIAARPVTSPVAILVSPPSFRVHWLLDRRADGVPWAARDSATEYDSGTADRRALPALMQRLTGLGAGARFISPAMLARGGLRAAGVRLLVLAQAIALSDAEVAAVRAFVAGGGVVLAEGEAGLFDGHGRRRASPPFPAGTFRSLEGGSLEAMAALLREAGAAPGFILLGEDGRRAAGVEARAWRSGGETLLALLTEGSATAVTLVLPRPGWVRDLRRGGAAVRTERLRVTLPDDGPVLLGIAPGE
jgi:hypothetical protein